MGNQPSHSWELESHAPTEPHSDGAAAHHGGGPSPPPAPSSEREDGASGAVPAPTTDGDVTSGRMNVLSQVWSALSPRAAARARDASVSEAASAPAQTASRRVEQFYDVSTQCLGRGHYAVVCRGKCRRTGRAVAIKKIKRFLTDEKRLRAEIAVLRRVRKHPNIVELIDVFETPREVHLVLELCTGGELFERLADKGPYSEADCVRHIRDMARAVQYLHEQGIIHRDLKPENILLSTPDDADAVTKVADFGLAKIFTGTNLKTKCGTWGYSAPEMISGSGVAFGYDFKVDSWSMGIIVYILLCGFHPFDPHGTNSDSEMIDCIKNCQYDFSDEAWDGISDDARDLIQHLLVLDPEQRYSMKELLAHPWIAADEKVKPSELPLSPRIHQDLKRFTEQTKKKAVDLFEEEVAST